MYRDDPAWQAAREDLISDLPDETASQALLRRLEAIARMREIEEKTK